MAQDETLRSDWRPPAWLTARPRPLVSQAVAPPVAGAVEGARAVPPVPAVPPEPPLPTASGVPPLPPRPAGVDPRPTLRSRPVDVERPEEACEIPVTRDVARDRAELASPAEPAEAAVPTEPVPADEPGASEQASPPATAAERADPDLAARLRAWQRVDQDLYRLLGYEETERLVFRDEGGNLVEAPGAGKLAKAVKEVKFELSRIEDHTWRDAGLWGTAALVALLAAGFVALVDWLPPFWTFVVVFLVSFFGRVRRRWRRRLDKVVEDHRLTYELVRQRLQPPT